MSTEQMNEGSLRAVQVRLEIEIIAPQETVWRSLITDINRWWPREFYATRSATAFVIEPFPGGRLYEKGPDDTGGLWAHVQTIDPPHMLSFNGHIGPPFGGPATSLVQITLEASATGTRFVLVDSIFGNISSKMNDNMDEGWRRIFEDGFKQFVESQAHG